MTKCKLLTVFITLIAAELVISKIHLNASGNCNTWNKLPPSTFAPYHPLGPRQAGLTQLLYLHTYGLFVPHLTFALTFTYYSHRNVTSPLLQCVNYTVIVIGLAVSQEQPKIAQYTCA